MADVRRVRAVWSGLPGSPYLSTWWFLADQSQPAQVVTALRKFLTTLAPVFSTGLAVSLDVDQVLMDEATGDMTGVESAPVGAAILGTSAGDVLPTQCQGVIKMTTGGIVNNRRVRGRFFVPAPMEGHNSNGPTQAYRDVLNTAAQTLIVDSVTFGEWCVWSRPVTDDPKIPSRPGTTHTIQTAGAWTKFGIQRRRRD